MTSIVVPNYNYAAYLKTRIEGILAQTCQDFELILLDDASTDNSRDIIESYRSHPKVTQVVYNDQNSGSAFRQWNKGVALAKGEYVWIAEADDEADPGMLGALVNLLDRHSRAGIAYTHSELIDPAGSPMGSAHEFLAILGWDWHQPFLLDGREAISSGLGLLNIVPNASAVVFRREAYLQAGPARADLRSTGDWMQWFNILKNWDLAYRGETLNRRRNHPASVTASAVRSVSGLADYLAVWTETRTYLSAANRSRLSAILKARLLSLRDYANLPIQTTSRLLMSAWPVDSRAVMAALPGLAGWHVKRCLPRFVVEQFRAMKRVTGH